MFVWPKEVIFGGSENFTILPKIRVGGDSKILSTNPYWVMSHLQSVDMRITQTRRLQLNPKFGQNYLQIKTASKEMYK